MAKTFFAGLSGGTYKAVIYAGPADVINTPGNRLQDVYFHSDLAYLKSNSNITGGLSLPARTPTTSSTKKKGTTVVQPAYGSASYQISATDYTSTNVVVVDTDNQRTISGTTIYQQVSEDSFRLFSVSILTTGLYLNEFYIAYSNTLPAVTLNYKIYPVVSPTDTTDATYWMYMNPSNFRIKNGTFNSNLGYVDVNSRSDAGGTSITSMQWSSYYYSTGGALQRYAAYFPESNRTEFVWDMFLTSRPASNKDTFDPELVKAGTLVYDVGFTSTKYNIDDGFTYDRGPEVFRKTTNNYQRCYYVRNTANTAWVFTQVVDADTSCAEKYASAASANGQNPNPQNPQTTITAYNVSNGNASTPHGSAGWTQISVYYPRAAKTLSYLVKDINSRQTGAVIFYQIRRGVPITTTTGRSGAALANGQTIGVYDQTDRAAASVVFNYDGLRKSIGDSEGKKIPDHQIFGLNLK